MGSSISFEEWKSKFVHFQKQVIYNKENKSTPYFKPIKIDIKHNFIIPEDLGKPMLEGGTKSTSKKKIIDPDRRYKVEDVYQYPYSAIGLISTDINQRFGTGTLISNNLVLTAAHNLYDFVKKENYKDICFYYGMENGKYNGKCKTIEMFVPNEYKTGGKDDFGLLYLDSPIGDTYGYIGITTDHIVNSSTTYSLFGYPGDLCEKNDKYIHDLYGMKTKNGDILQLDDDGILNYECLDTNAGQSGSSIWIEKHGGCYTIGIHCGAKAAISINVNQALYLNQRRVSMIFDWIVEKNIPTNILSSKKAVQRNNSLQITSNMDYLNKIELEDIKELDLQKCQLGNKELGEIRGNYPNLLEINLSNNNISDEGARYLTNWKCSKLKKMNLSSNRLTDVCIGLIKLWKFVELEEMDLSNNNITYEGFKKIEEWNFPKLINLEMYCSGLLSLK